MKKIYLCAICNIESGTCSEDCKFCTQSVKYKADIQRYKQKDIEQILYEANKAVQNKAIGFCLVTAGAGLDDTKLQKVAQIAHKVKKEYPELSLIGCNGIATKEQLLELKKAGIDNYNHNLETSEEYYPSICSTHSWEQRYQTCLNAKEVGLQLCSGGIFGMGESEENRASLINAIASLEPMSVPLNFFIENPALTLQNNISKQQAFQVISTVREKLPSSMIMVAGGRETLFKESQYDVFEYGANSIVIGDYLTTSGQTMSKDLEELEKRGYEIATDCQRQ
jgi:biotin synthase